MAEQFNFSQLKAEVRQKVIKELPSVIAATARNHFLSSFREQGWEGEPWKEVQRRIEGTKEYKYPKGYGLQRRTNPILRGGGQVKGSAGGRLRRDVSNSLVSQTFDLIQFKVSAPYAEYVNEGTDNMVARPFMKDGPVLQKLINDKIDQYMMSALEKGV